MGKYTEDQQGKFIAIISEILVGYREGSLDDMLVRAQELVNIEKQHNRQEKVADLFSEIRNLHYLANDIEEGSELLLTGKDNEI